MNPLTPWLDSDEVRRLAERLMRPVHNPSVTLSDVGFDSDFVGYAEARPSPPESWHEPKPEAAPAQQEAASPPAAVPPPPVEATARGPFLSRIQRFRDWMHHNFSATGVFILDREGSVIFDESNHGRLHFLARSLAHASGRPGASTRNVHVKIGAGATLEVIPVDTPYGHLVLGAVVPETLAPNALTAIMDALNQVASPPGKPTAE